MQYRGEKMSSRGATVETKNLSVSFGKHTVLSNINFTANPGEIHAIIGPNGGGKSTFVKALLGQLSHKGSITQNWTGEQGTIGYMPQSVAIDNILPITVRDYLALCIQQRPAFFGLSKKVKQTVAEVLEKLHLKGKEKFLFAELSGGERQRVLFAQALIPAPGVLILDEPMNSIDKSGAAIFSEIIYQLRSEGVTIIWIHHDLAEVKEKADYVTCLNREQIFSGNPKEVMDEKHLLEIFSARKSEVEVQ